MDYNLIGLSLSACTVDWIKGLINLDQIQCIFAGTAIESSSQIDEWIKLESRVNPTIKTMPSQAKEFINHLFDYPHKLIQTRLMNNGLKPVFRAGGINWIHKDKWIDWNKYHRTNQSCPFCGVINDYHETQWTMGSMDKPNLIELTCFNCHHSWTIETNSQWMHWESTDWMTPKL